MPIIGVSTREDLDPRFKSLGKLKKGAPKTEGLHDLEWFRFAPVNNDAALLQTFANEYGEEPTEIEPVYLPHNTMDECFSSWRELYGQNGLCKVRCNGSEWVDWIDGNAHRHGLRPCDKPYKDTANRCPDCPLKPVGRLEVILPKLWYAGYIGLVTVETHSWNDIATIAAKLMQWEPLQGRPFVLRRENTRIGVPIGKKRAAVEKSLIKIELTDERLIQMLEESQKHAALVSQNPSDGPDWDGYADLEAELIEPLDVDVIDEITAEDLSGGAMDTDAYEDLKEEQRPGRDISQLVPQHWGELYEMAERQYKVTPKAHVVNIIKKTYPDFTARGKEQPTVIAAWNAFVAYEQSKAE